MKSCRSDARVPNAPSLRCVGKARPMRCRGETAGRGMRQSQGRGKCSTECEMSCRCQCDTFFWLLLQDEMVD